MWTNFQKITKKHNTSNYGALEVDGVCLLDDEDKANAFASRFFLDSFNTNSPFHSHVTSELRAFLSSSCESPSPPLTTHELHTALHSAKTWKAAGPDRAPLIALLKCEDLLVLYLLPLFSASFHLVYFPQVWKTAIVVAASKPNGNHNVVKGFRPISLLCCLGKVLERVVTSRLTFF